MKTMIRTVALLLSLAFFLPLLAACSGGDDEASAPETVIRSETVLRYDISDISPDGIISPYRRFLEGTGIDTCGLSNHGGGQTRMVVAPSGTYFAFFTGTNSSADPLPIDLIRIGSDGTAASVFHTEMPYKPGGPMLSLMLDDDGNVWMYSGWEFLWPNKYRFSFSYHLWKYDPKTGETTLFETEPEYKHPYLSNNGGGGYSATAIDKKNHRIFAVVNCSDKPGFMEWATFDLETETWSEPQGVQLDYRYCSSYILPDGNKGFHIFSVRDIDVRSMKTDYGKSVYTTSKDTFTNWYDNNMLFDEWDYFHIPDAEESAIDMQFPVEEAVYQYQKGFYPDFRSNSSDIFLDSKGYLHFVYNGKQNDTPGDRNVHVVYDPNNGMKEILRQTMDSVGSSKTNYFFRMFQDATGAFYLVGIRGYSTPVELEIWVADEPDAEARLRYAAILPDDGEGIQAAGTAVAGARNGCSTGDTLLMAFFSNLSEKWYSFTVDFARLRAYLGR